MVGWLTGFIQFVLGQHSRDKLGRKQMAEVLQGGRLRLQTHVPPQERDQVKHPLAMPRSDLAIPVSFLHGAHDLLAQGVVPTQIEVLQKDRRVHFGKKFTGAQVGQVGFPELLGQQPKKRALFPPHKFGLPTQIIDHFGRDLGG